MTVPEYKDAIGQTIKGGDIVISIRDGTGAQPRMAVKFTPAKVSVSASWGTGMSAMDSCSLVVITQNVEQLIADGDQVMSDRILDLRTRFNSLVEQPAAKKPSAVPIRWCVYSYALQSNLGKPLYVSIHQVEGTGNEAVGKAAEESAILSEQNDLRFIASLTKEKFHYWAQGTSQHWSNYGTSAKDTLHSRKTMVEFGLDGMSVNTLLPVDYVNASLPQTYRIPNV